MMRRLAFAAALALLVAGLVAAERNHAAAAPSAQPILYLIADSERDLTRMPARFTRISDADEIAYGAKLADLYVREHLPATADDKAVEAYLQQVGSRIAPRAHRRLPYRFHYLRDRGFINAFALPGGHVFIGAGLVEQMTTEDELAAVVGHEIEHVDHYHCAERLQVEAALRKIPLASLLQIPIEVFQAGYSKDQELEADREGTLLAAKAGYSAAGALRVFTTLASKEAAPPRTPQGEVSRVAADVLSGYFRTHPPTQDRIAQVQAMIAREPSLAAPRERGIGVEYVFLARHGLDAVAEEKFAPAADLATRALQAHAGHTTALEALAEADYGLERFADAERAYRDLLARDTSGADRVEKWAEERSGKLYDQKEYGREAALADSVLKVQPGSAGLLRLASWAYARNGNIAAATERASTVGKLYPSSAQQFASESASAASDLFTSHDFAGAAAMARLSNAYESRQETWRTLAEAEFAQAQFAEAADAYRKIYLPDSSDDAWLRAFADALAAARPASAAKELAALFAEHPPKDIAAGIVSLESAGLALMAGNDVPARQVVQQVDAGAMAPEYLARLGWWYFRARRFGDADALLHKGQALRPGDSGIRNALAWNAFELGQRNDASPESDYGGDPLLDNETSVRNALAAWQSGRKADALRDWSSIMQNKPQWHNPAWREALYPPRVNATIQQIEAEQQRIASAAHKPRKV